jgi:hypothetical protein
MYDHQLSIEDAAPIADLDDDGVGVMRGLALGLAISAGLWLVPLSAWLLLH